MMAEAMNLHDVWASLQKAETMLVTTGMRLRPKDGPDLREGLDMPAALRPIFSRTVYSFDPRQIRASDYLIRYPFSTAEAIERQLKELVAIGILTGPEDGAYAVTEEAEGALRLHTERVGALIDRLDLEGVNEADVRILLDYDHRILDAMRESIADEPSPIFEHRLKGLRLDFDPPKRWHHWQLAWTMIAAHEDAEETIRVARGIEPLAWFARRELRSMVRRAHRARMKACADLPRLAQLYAPIDEAEGACAATLGRMEELGWIEIDGDACRLTSSELERADRDEAEIEEILFRRWPELSAEERSEVKRITDAINVRCEELRAKADASAE